ncbi:MAG: glycosyltransferase family 4 protein [Thiogranum sp.]
MQPWLTIRQVGRYLLDKGHDVLIVTDIEGDADVAGIPVHRVASLRGSNSGQVRALVEKLDPDCAVVLVTPLNLATTAWYELFGKIPAHAFASYPFYRRGELFTALRTVETGVLSSYLRHLLVPELLWKKKLRSLFSSVICQSESTRGHLSGITREHPPVHSIPPGIDKSRWVMRRDEWPADDDALYLYVGRASRIRGFYVALDAMTRLRERDIRLKVLARGADNVALEEIAAQVKRRGLENRVEVEGGWLDQQRLVEEIQAATAVLLPFVLVPSELPVSAMEAIACGTPVITTNIDGLPSTVGKAGLVVNQGSAEQLAGAMLELYTDKERLDGCREACVRQTGEMLSWGEMGDKWEEVLDRG